MLIERIITRIAEAVLIAGVFGWCQHKEAMECGVSYGLAGEALLDAVQSAETEAMYIELEA